MKKWRILQNNTKLMENEENLNNNGIKNVLDDLILSVKNNKENFGEDFSNIIDNLTTLKNQVENNDFSFNSIKESLSSLKQKIDSKNIFEFKKELSELVTELEKIEKQKENEFNQISSHTKKELNKLSFNPTNLKNLKKQAELGRKKSYEKVEHIVNKIASANIPFFSKIAKILQN